MRPVTADPEPAITAHPDATRSGVTRAVLRGRQETQHLRSVSIARCWEAEPVLSLSSGFEFGLFAQIPREAPRGMKWIAVWP